MEEIDSFNHQKCTSAFLRRTFSICTVKGQAFSLLGRLEGLGAGAAAAQGRRSQAAQQEQLWRRQRQAHALCVRQGRDFEKGPVLVVLNVSSNTSQCFSALVHCSSSINASKWKNAPLENVPKDWAGPSPLILTKYRRKHFFLRRTSLISYIGD